MPLLYKALCTRTELKFFLSRCLVIRQNGYMTHNLSNFGELRGKGGGNVSVEKLQGDAHIRDTNL
jgi:hypothetical protein